MAGPHEQRGRTEPGLELERSHAARLGQCAGVGVGQRDDVAEDLVQRTRRALAFLAGGHTGKLLQLTHQNLELLVALPIHDAEPPRQIPCLWAEEPCSAWCFCKRSGWRWPPRTPRRGVAWPPLRAD